MKRFDLVHNILSPYRFHLFRELADQLNRRDVSLHVHFMARTHRDRAHWEAVPAELEFPHTIWRDVGPYLWGKEWHLNPGLVTALTREPVDYFMMWGPWDSLTGFLLSLLVRRDTGIAFLETTRDPAGTSRPLLMLKKFLLARYEVVTVPGERAVDRIDRLLGKRAQGIRIAMLPQLVDESKFVPAWEVSQDSRREMRRILGVEAGDRVAIWPARHIWEKGIPEFLSVVDEWSLNGWKILLLGDGPLRSRVEDVVKTRGLESSVLLRANLSYVEMPLAYATSDLLLLPSLSDPNPLAVVEALHSGLPLLVSNRIGNFPEALQEGENGWALDPDDPDGVKAKVREAFDATPPRLREMGRQSKAIAMEFWNSEQAIEQFLDAVLV